LDDLPYGRSKYWSESDAVVVFLLLGVIWAAVLVPPWLQSRREARSIASIMSFRSQLWSLQRATPRYGADVYSTYGDDSYDDERADALVDDHESEGAAVHAFVPDHAPAHAVSPGIVGAVVRRAADGPAHRPASAPTAAAAHRRALAFRRRRRVLSALVLLAAAGAAPAVMFGGPWLAVEAVVGALLVAYLGMLVNRGRREAERAQKVRYLTPIRAPRPAVVIISSGAAR
jgi:hypothetical protein